jgi:hypothetical protein
MTHVLLWLAIGCSDPASAPDAGTDVSLDGGATPCTAGATLCEDDVFSRCGADGQTREDSIACPASCDPELGCVACVPGTRRCNGTRSERCSAERAWVLVRDCERWESACGESGLCEDACAAPESSGDYLGCEYQLVRTPRAPGWQTVTAVVANPGDELATVEVVHDGVVARAIELEARAILDVPIDFPITFDGSAVSRSDVAVIRSSRPITATQFYPFEDDGSYNADASLLFPRHSLGTRHLAVSYGPISYVAEGVVDPELGYTPNTFGHTRGSVSIAAPPTERARITVRPSAPIQADPSGRVPAVEAGGVLHLELAAGEVVHLLAAHHPLCSRERPSWTALPRECWNDPPSLGGARHCLDPGYCPEPEYDLTGTLVESDVPVAVFSGHECAFVPLNRFACDHLEEQVPPVSTWGREHVSASVGPDAGDGPNRVRVVASRDGTTVAIDPPQGGTASAALDRGEWIELTVEGVFRITANEPVLVAQYLYGQGFDDGTLIGERRGDPSLWIVPPVEQYRSDYAVSLPRSYLPLVNGALFLLVVRPIGSAIAFDGAPWDVSVAGSTGEWEVGVVQVESGIHRLVSEDGFSLVQIGMADFTSFATPAGRGIRPLLE